MFFGFWVLGSHGTSKNGKFRKKSDANQLWINILPPETGCMSNFHGRNQIPGLIPTNDAATVEVNSSMAALNILRRLQRVPVRLLQRKRRRLWPGILPTKKGEEKRENLEKNCLQNLGEIYHKFQYL